MHLLFIINNSLTSSSSYISGVLKLPIEKTSKKNSFPFYSRDFSQY